MRATRALVPALLMAASFCYQALSTPMKFTETPKLGLTSARQEVGEWADCSVSPGLCINTNVYSCTSGTIVTGQCPGGSNILCCTAPGGIRYGQCDAAQNGLCKRTADCPTTTVTGLCPGPSGVTCCTSGGTVPVPLPSGDVPVTPGIYLESNPPQTTQFRARRASPRPVIVVHTAESGPFPAGSSDQRAENTAGFIRGRSDPGSYHLLGDTNSIIQLIAFDNAAFHDATGSNEWSIGISLAMNANEWPTLEASVRDKLVGVAAQMAEMAAEWFVSKGLPAPAAKELTLDESNQAGASGFVAHGTRDPGRRTDPGEFFPWDNFLAVYQARINGS